MEPLIIQVFLRGGADALSVLPPLSGDDRKIYEEERPNLQIPVEGANKILPLDQQFGLHPAASGLHDLFLAKHLSVVKAVGLVEPSRSHFDAQAMIETGNMDPHKPVTDGWLTRLSSNAQTGVRFVGLGALLPNAFLNCGNAIAMNDLDGFRFGGGNTSNLKDAVRRMYIPEQTNFIGKTMLATISAMDEFEQAKPEIAKAVKGPDYGPGEFAKRLHLVAQMLRMGLPLQNVAVDYGGWDTHRDQGRNGEGHFADLIRQLSQPLSAFYNEVTGLNLNRPFRIAVFSEFGRRVKENGNGGCDHGHGGFFLCLGSDVAGGKVLGDWPGLATEQLFERADVRVTTDVRAPILEMIGAEPGSTLANKIFPGAQYKKKLGLLRA